MILNSAHGATRSDTPCSRAGQDPGKRLACEAKQGDSLPCGSSRTAAHTAQIKWQQLRTYVPQGALSLASCNRLLVDTIQPWLPHRTHTRLDPCIPPLSPPPLLQSLPLPLPPSTPGSLPSGVVSVIDFSRRLFLHSYSSSSLQQQSPKSLCSSFHPLHDCHSILSEAPLSTSSSKRGLSRDSRPLSGLRRLFTT